MEMLETVKKELETTLSEERYKHSLGVMKMAQILAKQYNINEQEALLTGLAHDMAKELTTEQNLQYIKQNQIEIDEVEERNPSLLHAKIGADMAKKKYSFNQKMQDAIAYHTTGNPKMDTLAKIIYVADKTEENRNFEGVEELRNLALKDLNQAVVAILSYDIKKNINRGRIIHPNSILTRNKLLMTSISPIRING